MDDLLANFNQAELLSQPPFCAGLKKLNMLWSEGIDRDQVGPLSAKLRAYIERLA